MRPDTHRLAHYDDAGARIAPDPLGSVLPALAALGCIASIAGVLWAAQTPDLLRARNRRKVAHSLRDLETDCAALHEIFNRLGRNLKLLGGDRAMQTASLKFGLHGLKVSQHSYGAYQSLVGDIAAVLPSTSQNAFDVMCAIEDGQIDAPDEIFYGFGECQEQLNQVLVNRTNVLDAADIGLEIAARLLELVRALKGHIVA